jgi:hypothetical protein
MLTSLLHSIRKARGIMATKKARGDPLTLWLSCHNYPNPMIPIGALLLTTLNLQQGKS